MARINTKGLLSGTVGNYTFKVINGIGIVQSRPGKGGVKQTVATKSSASEFGNAHRLAKKIREAQFPLLQDMADSRMYNRFATALYRTVLSADGLPKGTRTIRDGDLGALGQFQFNIQSPFSKYCSVPIQAALDGQDRMHIVLDAFDPTKDVLNPEMASEARLAILVTAFDPEDGTESHAELFQLAFGISDTATQTQEWTSGVLPKGTIVFVSAALFYYRDNSLIGPVGLNSKKMHPAEIVKVFAI